MRTRLFWIGPFGRAADGLDACPGEAFAADADSVAHRLAAAEHEIEIGIRRIHHDGARGLARRIAHQLTPQPRRERLVLDGVVAVTRVIAQNGLEHRGRIGVVRRKRVGPGKRGQGGESDAAGRESRDDKRMASGITHGGPLC